MIEDDFDVLMTRKRNPPRTHEIAFHGYAHKVIYNQTPPEYREDIKISKEILEELTDDEVFG